MAEDRLIRAEAARLLWRWREAATGAAALALGLWWLADGTRVLAFLGLALIAGGSLLALAGVQRARFRRQGDGPGVVRVTEGQLAYFGPFDGGLVAIRDILRLEIDPRPDGARWILGRPAQAPLEIPVNAAGAEALFDVFAALPGIDTAAMLAALERDPAARVTVWERPRDVLPPTLH